LARKLKTYQTSLGFFDQAIAAPSMKAALEAWGADSNLFHQGAAKESHDANVIAATMAKPGVVLKRPVGSDGPFGEHAGLPTDLGDTDKPAKVTRRSKARKSKKSSSRPADKAAERKAVLAYGREQKRRGRVAKAQAAVDKAEREHAKRADEVRDEAEALEKKSQEEEARWNKEKERLNAALRRVRS
jgi:hypothetical protein